MRDPQVDARFVADRTTLASTQARIATVLFRTALPCTGPPQRMVPRWDCDLLPLGEILQKEAAAKLKRANERYKQEHQHARQKMFISWKTQHDRAGWSFGEEQLWRQCSGAGR